MLAYLRLRHKDPLRGFVLCCVVCVPPILPYMFANRCHVNQSRTIVHTVTVGSVSFAQAGPKAMHNASTAQEVQIISPTATDFQFRVSISSYNRPSVLTHHLWCRNGTIRHPCLRVMSPLISLGSSPSPSLPSVLRNRSV